MAGAGAEADTEELEMVHLEGWLSKSATGTTTGALKKYYFIVATGEAVGGATVAEIRWYKNEQLGTARGTAALDRDTKIRLLEGDALLVKSDGRKIALHPVDAPGTAAARTTAAQWYQALDFAVQSTKRAHIMPRRLTVDPNSSSFERKKKMDSFKKGKASSLSKIIGKEEASVIASPPLPPPALIAAARRTDMLPATLAQLFRRPRTDKHRIRFADLVHKAFAGECIEFLEACELYESEWAGASSAHRRANAVSICVRFVEEGSEQQVNLSSDLRTKVLLLVEMSLSPLAKLGGSSRSEMGDDSSRDVLAGTRSHRAKSGSAGSHGSLGVIAVPPPSHDEDSGGGAAAGAGGAQHSSHLSGGEHSSALSSGHMSQHDAAMDHHKHHDDHLAELGADLFAEASIEMHDLLNKNFFERFLKEARIEQDKADASFKGTGEGCFSSLWDLMKLDAYNAIVAHFGPVNTDLYRLEQFYKHRLNSTTALLEDTESAIARLPIHVALPEQRVTSRALRSTYRCNDARRHALIKFTTEIEREVLRPLEELRTMLATTLDRIVKGASRSVEVMDANRRKHRSSINHVRSLLREEGDLTEEFNSVGAELGASGSGGSSLSESFDGGETQGDDDGAADHGRHQPPAMAKQPSSRRGLFGMLDRRKLDKKLKAIQARVHALKTELAEAHEGAEHTKLEMEKSFNTHSGTMIKAMDALEVLELHRIEAQQQILANGALAERSLLERQARMVDDAREGCVQTDGDSALNDLRSFALKLKRAADRAKKAKKSEKAKPTS